MTDDGEVGTQQATAMNTLPRNVSRNILLISFWPLLLFQAVRDSVFASSTIFVSLQLFFKFWQFMKAAMFE
jgi:hypothetical protein